MVGMRVGQSWPLRPGGVRGALAALACLVAAPVAAEPVDLELVLAVDTSSSVNFTEFGLQMRGLAEAFRDPTVIQAIEAGAPRGLAVSMVQWSGEASQTPAVDWHVVRDRASAEAFAAVIDQTPRLVIGGATAIGSALAVATAWLEENAYEGARRVIDVSGDGRTNQGPWTALARQQANALGIVVNGLAILNEEPRLDRYYLAAVVGGPGAFLVTADDFDDFSRAIVRKLVTEISGQPMVQAPRPDANGEGAS